MGEAPSLIMRGNGALATASTPGRAMARLYLLERSAETWLRAAAVGEPAPPQQRAKPPPGKRAGEELLERLWEYLSGRVAVEVAALEGQLRFARGRDGGPDLRRRPGQAEAASEMAGSCGGTA